MEYECPRKLEPTLDNMNKWLRIVIIFILLMVLLAFTIEWIYLKRNTAKEVFLLPDGFTGIVLIAFDQKDGLAEIGEHGVIAYKIPKNGVVKLKAPSPPSLLRSSYYFEDETGKRTLLYYCTDQNEMKGNPNTLYVFGRRNVTFENNGVDLRYTTFLVGKERDRDSLYRKSEKMDPLEVLKTSPPAAADR
jgi:hypothetical protein